MCVEWKSEWEETTEDITAYKIVVRTEDGKYESPLPVENRAKQDIGGSAGEVLTYETGKGVESAFPGIYLLAWAVNVEAPHVVLKVTIPKGTPIRRGRTLLRDSRGTTIAVGTINALAVVVGEERPNTQRGLRHPPPLIPLAALRGAT